MKARAGDVRKADPGLSRTSDHFLPADTCVKVSHSSAPSTVDFSRASLRYDGAGVNSDRPLVGKLETTLRVRKRESRGGTVTSQGDYLG